MLGDFVWNVVLLCSICNRLAGLAAAALATSTSAATSAKAPIAQSKSCGNVRQTRNQKRRSRRNALTPMLCGWTESTTALTRRSAAISWRGVFALNDECSFLLTV